MAMVNGKEVPVKSGAELAKVLVKRSYNKTGQRLKVELSEGEIQRLQQENGHNLDTGALITHLLLLTMVRETGTTPGHIVYWYDETKRIWRS